MLLLFLVFQLFNEFVERRDHTVFHLEDPRPGLAQVEPPADVFHAAGNVIERILLQIFQVGPHQVRHGYVAARTLWAALEEPIDGPQPCLAFQQPVTYHRLVEQQRGGVRHVTRLQAGELLVGFIK